MSNSAPVTPTGAAAARFAAVGSDVAYADLTPVPDPEPTARRIIAKFQVCMVLQHCTVASGVGKWLHALLGR